MKIIAWNVNGIRAAHRKADVGKFLAEHEPDVMCFIETKLPKVGKKMDDLVESLASVAPEYAYRTYHPSRARAGYAGTVVWSKQEPVSVTLGLPHAEDPDLREDLEGRVITVEYATCTVIAVYTPNAGQGLKRLAYRTQTWDAAFRDHVQCTRAKAGEVMVVGDLNCAHQEVDIHDPVHNVRSSGFTPQERANFDLLLTDCALVDSWRTRNADAVGKYTYWSFMRRARERNMGWRIDYVLCTPDLDARVDTVEILDQQLGSDHVPVVVTLRL